MEVSEKRGFHGLFYKLFEQLAISDKSSTIDINTSLHSIKFVLIANEDEIDSSILMEALHLFYNINRAPIIFIPFNQSFEYYSKKALKHGFDLNDLRSKEHLIVMDALHMYQTLLTQVYNDNNSTSNPLAILADEDNPEKLKRLYELITLEITNLHRGLSTDLQENCFIVVMDNIDSLLKVGVCIRDILDLIQYCRRLIIDPEMNGKLFVKMTKSSNDTETQQLINYCGHVADWFIESKGKTSNLYPEYPEAFTLKMKFTNESSKTKTLHYKTIFQNNELDFEEC